MPYTDIVKTLCMAGYETYIVGGAVRDILSNKEPEDFDIATSATPEEIEALFGKSRTKGVGKSFGITLIDDIEVATFRNDQYTQLLNPKKCVVMFTDSIHDDLSRRDLTINAMAMCALSGELIDNHKGRDDLKKRRICFVGNPTDRIHEDPARMIRACRFYAGTEGEFDKDTLKALTTYSFLIKNNVAPERIRIEILKALKLKTPSLFFSALHLIGALKFIFPEMDECFGHPHGNYHVETVGEHIMMAGDLVSPRFPLVRLAAFMHDVGKPKAFKKQNDGSFICHELYGGKIVEESLKRLKFSNEEIKVVSGLVYSHMLQCRSLKKAAARRLQKKLFDAGIDPRSFIRLKLADRAANMLRDKNKIQPIKELIINAGIRGDVHEEIPFLVTDLALSGGQLIKLFNLKPGPVVGKLQKFLLSVVIDNGEDFNTEEVLEEQAKVFLNGYKE